MAIGGGYTPRHPAGNRDAANGLSTPEKIARSTPHSH
jgi:hypothetical protein